MTARRKQWIYAGGIDADPVLPGEQTGSILKNEKGIRNCFE